MLSQCWLMSGDISLAAVSHQPNISRRSPGVVLFPGFSQSMCDTDYFMSKLARRLANESIYTLQVDPRGHGDSPGYLEDVTLNMLRADIQNAVNYAGQQSGGEIICVGRGLTATLMAELAGSPLVYRVAGINPYCLAPETVSGLFKNIGPGNIDTADILTGNDFKHFSDFDQDRAAFFDALGSGLLLNLLGQKISTKILHELMNFEPDQILKTGPERKFWLIPAKNAAGGMCRWVPDEDASAGQCCRALKEYRENPFPSDPLWHHNAIEKICEWIAAQRGE